MDAEFGPYRAKYGTTLYDVVYLVSTCDGKTAAKIAESVLWDDFTGELVFTRGGRIRGAE